MADKKISELDAITGANTAATDAFVVVDTSTGQTKKITREELNNAIEQDVLSTVDINGGTIDGTTIGATTAAAGSFTTVGATGNITVGGTVDGRDVATDGTKLDGIEASATADQTGAEIATALNGETISSLTALTTTGAVIVGGDFTVNGTTTTINSTTLEVDDKNIVLASGAADAAAANGSGITIDGASATFNYASTGDKWTFNKPIDVTGNIIVSGTVDGRDVAADGTKLDGIETGATADQTKSDIDALGIDAATLDGIDSSSFLRSDAADTTTGDLTISKDSAKLRLYDPTGTTSTKPFIEFDTTQTQGVAIELNIFDGELPENGYGLVVRESTTNTQWPSTGDLTFSVLGEIYAGSESLSSVNKVWHAGNDGSGSGLDADTVDGIQASSFVLTGENANLGDGTNISMSSASAGQLTIDGSGYSGAIALNANGMHIYHNSSSRYMSFGINETEEMRLETDGDLHVDGNVVAYSTTISDIRLKKDIAPIEDAVTKVQQLNGCTFTYLKDDRKSAGLIAQDVEKVLPSAVIEDEAVFHGEEGETYKTVQYDQVIGLLVEAVKELKAEIEELKNGTAK